MSSKSKICEIREITSFFQTFLSHIYSTYLAPTVNLNVAFKPPLSNGVAKKKNLQLHLGEKITFPYGKTLFFRYKSTFSTKIDSSHKNEFDIGFYVFFHLNQFILFITSRSPSLSLLELCLQGKWSGWRGGSNIAYVSSWISLIILRPFPYKSVQPFSGVGGRGGGGVKHTLCFKLDLADHFETTPVQIRSAVQT